MYDQSKTHTLRCLVLHALHLLPLLLFCSSAHIVTGSILGQRLDHIKLLKANISSRCLPGNFPKLQRSSAIGQLLNSISRQDHMIHPLVHVEQKFASKISQHANFGRGNSVALMYLATTNTSRLSNNEVATKVTGSTFDARSELTSPAASRSKTVWRRGTQQRENSELRKLLMPLSSTTGGEVQHGPNSQKLFETNDHILAPARAPGDINIKRWKAPFLETGPLIIVNVAIDGSGDFLSIQEAIDSIPLRNTQRVLIRIHPGVYREKVTVPYNKPFVTFHGDEDAVTVITWNATATTPSISTEYTRKNVTLFGTFLSASVSVLSDGFIAQHITFENSAPPPEPGAVGAQAVAFLIAGDRAAFYSCRFLGAQDTLYDYTGRHYYMSCFIQGSIDFIFGNGRSLFQKCILHSIATSFGAIAAHQRLSLEDDTGFIFDQCEVRGSGMLYLGRAWSPFARIVFAHTYLADIIFAEGWSDFGDPRRRRTTFFGQYQCRGPGANDSQRVPWSRQLTENDVLPFLSLDFVNAKEWLHEPPS